MKKLIISALLLAISTSMTAQKARKITFDGVKKSKL